MMWLGAFLMLLAAALMGWTMWRADMRLRSLRDYEKRLGRRMEQLGLEVITAEHRSQQIPERINRRISKINQRLAALELRQRKTETKDKDGETAGTE